MSGGGGGKKGGTPVTYSVDCILGLCEGPIFCIDHVYKNSGISTFAQTGLTLFTGEVGQAPWSFLVSNFPTEATPYSGCAYAAAAPLGLGQSPSLPSMDFEVAAILAGTAGFDADPSQVLTAILTSAQFGAGFPSSAIGTVVQAQESYTAPSGSPWQITVAEAASFRDNLSVSINGALATCVATSATPASGQYNFTAGGLYTFASADAGKSVVINYSWVDGLTDYQAFCLASGLWISPAYIDQQQTYQVIGDLLKYTFSEGVWSQGVFQVKPRGVTTVSGAAAAVTFTGPSCAGNGGLSQVNFAWSNDKGADISLSNSDLTATISAAGPESVLSTSTIPAGTSVYFEVTGPSGASTGAYDSQIGPFNPPIPDIASPFDNSSWGWSPDGSVGRMITPPAGWPTNGFGYGLVASFGAADTRCFFVKVLANGTSHWWFRTIHNGVVGSWNNSAIVGLPSDPATDTAPFVMGTSVNGVGPYIAQTLSGSTSNIVANFGPAFLATPGTSFTLLNGYYTYTPNLTPVYALGLDDFMPNTAGSVSAASSNSDPVIITRKRAADQINEVQVEFLDRANNYNASIADQFDQALIDRYGRRFSGSQQGHLFTTSLSANVSAQLLLQKEYVRKLYSFVTDERYIDVDPMDFLTLTEPGAYLNAELVRVQETTEQDDGTIQFIAEEVPGGTGTAPLYSFNQSRAQQLDTNVDPGPVNPPIFLTEPSAMNDGALEIGIGISGSGAFWGGAAAYVSKDMGASYTFIRPQIGRTTMGVTTTALAAGADPDTVNSVGVDLTESDGEVSSASQTNADAFLSLALVGGEIVAYTEATLTADFEYTLDTYLRRGVFGTSNQVWPAGSPFMVLDGAVFTVPYTTADIGSTWLFKFVGFNIWGGGPRTLAEETAYPYTIGGAVSVTLTASENLVAGALVDIWDNAGVANVRNANATDGTKPADGFVLQSVTASNPAMVFVIGGQVTGLAGLTPGAVYYLATSNGAVTATPPSSSGNLVQQVGKALSATTLLFQPYAGVVF